MVEAGTQLAVLENSLQRWGQFGEEDDSNRQQLTTRMLRMVPLLTGDPVSLVRRYVDRKVKFREFIDVLERHHDNLTNGEEINFPKVADLFNQPEGRSSSVKRGGSVDVRRLDRSKNKEAHSGTSLDRTVQRERVKECLEDLHDFDGASDWLLQVTVKQHDGKDDEVGERIEASKVKTAKDYASTPSTPASSARSL